MTTINTKIVHGILLFYIYLIVFRCFILYSALHRLTNIKGNRRLTLLVLLFLYWDGPFSACTGFLSFLYSDHLFVFYLFCCCFFFLFGLSPFVFYSDHPLLWNLINLYTLNTELYEFRMGNVCNVMCMQLYYTIGKPRRNPMLAFYPDRGTESVELWRVQYYFVVNLSYDLHKLLSEGTHFILN